MKEQVLKSSNTKSYATTGYKKNYNPLKYLFFTKSYLIIWTNGNDGKFIYMVNDETKDDHKLSFLTDIKFGIDVFFKDYYLEKKTHIYWSITGKFKTYQLP